jgi:2-C-methyl-D-erythritol 4-phosphate cytidylyltransferase
MASRPGEPRKQFVDLGGAPVVVQSLRAFASHPRIEEVVVVMPADDVDAGQALLARHDLSGVRVVAGGATRQASVSCGLEAVEAQATHVLVHDAVRPFVSPDLIGRVIDAALATGAAAPGVPVADTVRRGAQGLYGEPVEREGLRAMQTPQAARADWLRTALAQAGAPMTDEVGALQAAGYPVAIVDGDEWNRKLTRPADRVLAEALWPVWERLRGR